MCCGPVGLRFQISVACVHAATSRSAKGPKLRAVVIPTARKTRSHSLTGGMVRWAYRGSGKHYAGS
ncbi:hypothetical protein TR2A62_3055 [Thalassobium sp. R2A62]|nr:hypothetical protein TR2A62_3055 [Thalassobium sp. R2A62]